MNNKGFTLMELLVVVSIIAVVGVASVISFSTIKDDTATKELKNKYIEIQRAASLYLDLNSNDQAWFIQNKRIDIKLNDLKNENYITSDLTNPVTLENISLNYYVRFCITNDENNNQEVDSCIIDKTQDGIVYIADSYGIEEGTCCE